MNTMAEEKSLKERAIPWLKGITITALVLNLAVDIFLKLVEWFCLR